MSNSSGLCFETRAEVCSRYSAEGIVYKRLLVAPQAPPRSHSGCVALGTALSCLNFSFPEVGVAMGLALCICPGRLPILHPSWRDHHRVTWEMLPVKVSDQFYQRLSNWEGPTGDGREGAPSTLLDISPHCSTPPCAPVCGPQAG